MLKIIVESESTQQRYTRLKDSLGSPTDSILLDMLLSCYADSKEIVAKEVIGDTKSSGKSYTIIKGDDL